MRIWEVEDNKAASSNLVHEQDFILRIRRLNRQALPYLIINFVLTAASPSLGGRGPLEEAQERLQAFATSTKAMYADMSNGDVFLIWAENGLPRDLQENALLAAFPTGLPTEITADFVKMYHLPRDYALLRERSFSYVEQSRSATATDDNPSQLLQTEAARGPLTAWSVDQIEKLLQNIDLHKYVRTQKVYSLLEDGTWQVMLEEWFVSFKELGQAHFPKMEITSSDHLFREVCQSLDGRLLTNLSRNLDVIASRNISVNLSIRSLMDSVFASFSHMVPRPYHSRITCEIDCGDLLQDFSQTQNAFSSLHAEGFRVAIDGVTADMLRFVNFGLFKADYVKLNVSQERYDLFKDPLTRQALKAIPAHKIIFSRCDHEEAVRLGLSLGVTKYQGWYLDKFYKTENPEV